MNDNNYIVIQGWMVNQLHLSGNELLCYAFIYGFSQDGQSKCDSSLTYMAESISISKSNLQKVIKRLCDKNLITKEEMYINGVKFCSYRHKGGMPETGIPYSKRDGGMPETGTNIYIDNSNNNNKGFVQKKEVDREEDFVNQLRQNTSWREVICMKYHIKDNILEHYFDDFLLDIRCNQTKHTYLDDVTKHFNNWLRIQLNCANNNNGKQQSNNRSSEGNSNRRGYDAPDAQPSDYEGAF